MESYNPNPLKRNALGPEDTNQSKHVKLSTENNQPNKPYSTPTCDPDPAISVDDEQTLVWVKQLLGVQEDSNAIENIDSQNNDQLLSIDDDILPLLHIDDEIIPPSSTTEHNSLSIDEMDDMQYIRGRLNTEGGKLFRTDLIAVIKEFEKNNDRVNARKYRDLLHQASLEYDYNDIVWLRGEKIGFKATEEEIKKHYKTNGKLLGKFISFCSNYKELRSETVQSIPVKKADPTNEPKDRSINYVTRSVNDTNEAQKNRRDLSSVEMDDKQYIKGHVNGEGATLFRTDLIAIIKEFEKNNDEINSRKYRDLLHQASLEYDYNDIVWLRGEKIGFKATEEEIKKHYKINGNKNLGKFKNFCLNYTTLRRKIVQRIPDTVKKTNLSHEPVSESVALVARSVNDTNETQKDRTDISSAEMDDMQYIKGLHVNSEGAKLFRTDLIAVIKEFEKDHDTVNASKYRELLRQASREYSNRDIVWFTGEKIGFKATEKEIHEIETSKKSHGKLLGKFIGFCLNYKTLRRQTVQSIPVTVKKSNPTHEPISESADRGAIQWVFFQGKSPIRTTQTIEHQDANSLLPQMNQRRA